MLLHAYEAITSPTLPVRSYWQIGADVQEQRNTAGMWAGPPAGNDSYLSLVALRVTAEDAIKHADYIIRATSNQEAD